MPRLLVHWKGQSHGLAFTPGQSVREILEATEWRVRTACRGQGACGLCRIRIDRGAVTTATQTEQLHLDPGELDDGVRLACQTRPHQDLELTVLEPARETRWKSVLHSDVTPPRGGAPKQHWWPPEVREPLAVAVDLGTTNIRITLLDLRDGAWISQRRGANPQADFGSDVMSRLDAAGGSEQAAREIRDLVVEALGEALHEILAEQGLSPRSVVGVGVVGNTAMLTLLAGANYRRLLDPTHWGAVIDHPLQDAAALRREWHLHPAARLELYPSMAGFVGSDLLAGLLATDLTGGPAPALLIDFGTNSEIALWNGERLLITSAAGGPAFELSSLSCGMPAEPGAIYRVDGCGEVLRYRVVGDGEARGICGSGLVDLVRCLLRRGELGEIGRFVGADGQRYPLAVVAERPLALTLRDIDALQRAKGAIGAAVVLLARRAGVDPAGLARVCVAGEFGRFLDISNAQAIGLLPPCAEGAVEICGDTALLGCADLLREADPGSRITPLRRLAEPINLGQVAEFDELFLENLFLRPLRG